MKLLSYFDRLFWRYLASPEKEARHLGVSIGKNCLISTRYWSSEPYLITIGNHVQVTNGVSFYTHGGGHVVRQKHPAFDCFGKICIKDGAYIGAWSLIMPGVTIGEGALIAAGSVVTKSVPPHIVVGGNPAHYICTTEEYYERIKKYDLGLKRKRITSEEKRRILLDSPDEMFIVKSDISFLNE